MWAWGVLICVGCVTFAGFCASKWLFWVVVEKDVKIRRSGVVGEVLAVNPGLAVETGPGGVGRRWNWRISESFCSDVLYFVLNLLFPVRHCLVSYRRGVQRCAAVCARASCGPGDGLSPCASLGYGNARFVRSTSCENASFLPILVLMQSELVLALRRLIFTDI